MTDNLPGRTMPEGSKRQLEHLAVDDQRMAGVMAALKTHDDIGGNRQPIDDLALSLVAPLGADHDDIGHPLRTPELDKQNPGASDNGLGRGSLRQ